MKLKNKSIFISLIVNYIIYVLILIMLLILALLFTASQISNSEKYGQLPKITSIDVVRADYENIYIKDIDSFGGWVEILDENMNVIYVKGSKKDDKMSYTGQDIFSTLNMDSSNRYLGIMQAFKSKDDKNLYCLVKYPGNIIKYQLDLKKSSYEAGSFIYKNLIKGAIFFIILFIANIILFSKWTSKNINKPLKEITNGITKMANGDYDARIEFKAEEEFAVIRDSFNFMTEKLKNTEEEKIKIEQDKIRLLVDLSHDIKTPISTIQCFSKALSEGLINDEEKKQRYYKTIYSKGERVNELIDDLFEFVKLESIDYRLCKTKTDFAEFTRKIVSEFYDEIEEKCFNLDLKIPSNEIIIEFDEKLMARAVSNILSNALKYNPISTKLRIEIMENYNELILEIADNGMGIPAHIKDYIFNPFVRGDESRRSDGGTGLGLAIAKKIVEKHCGKLEVIDGKNDEKTIFRISFKY